jgi:hypothetical protein
MERLCEGPNSVVEDLRHHCRRGSASGKPIPFEAGRAFGTCAFDSRPLRQVLGVLGRLACPAGP